jgi:hypothetical protein
VQVTRMELVEHDWYNSHDTKQVLAGFSLGYPASMPPR